MHEAALFVVTAVLLLYRERDPFLGIREFAEESPGCLLKHFDLMKDFRITGRFQVRHVTPHQAVMVRFNIIYRFVVLTLAVF
jgi:hypothetical protein